LAYFGVSVTTPTILLSDSTCAISIMRDPVKHELTKHICVDASFVCASVHDQIIALQYVPSELQLANFFMKAQTRAQHGFYQNSVLWIHHEFQGGVSAILCIVYFPVCMRSYIFSTYTCIYTGIWPSGNTSCIFLTVKREGRSLVIYALLFPYQGQNFSYCAICR
jgi:hypothetical protein